jgi:molecular chaperone DnaJ|tara:strand:- start:3113 stop:4087 length:975 start_codon:yes stop_codon:yes gene_type:complete
MADNPYTVLGVPKDATNAEIKRVYRKLARQYHPDRNPGDAAAEEKFKSIQAAYDTVGTPEERKEYDNQGRVQDMFGNGNPFSNFGGGGFPRGPDIGDIFSQFMGGRNQQQGNPPRNNPQNSRSQRQTSSQPQKGSDIESGLDITLDDAVGGIEIQFNHRRLKVCRKCSGGTFGTTKNCSECNASGVSTRESTITVKVPPGAIHGQQLRLNKMGNEHPNGEPGDLIINIRLDAEEGRRWENGRLIQDAPISYTTIILGGKIKITTPNNKRIQIDVPPRSKIGDRRRLNGHGHDGGPLDIEFSILEPEKLSKKQIAALEKLKELGL